MAEIASAYISLLPSAAGFQSKLNGAIGGDVEKAGKTSGSRFGKVFATASIKPFRAFGAAALGFFAVDKVKDFFGSAIDEARESQKVSALTAQVIKTTGGAANISAAQIGNLSQAISNKVGIDDEAIQSGANMLLTFTNVRNEVGKGNKVFNEATRLATDMSAALGGDAKSAALQLGKALNDPAKGVTKLARSGVSFTEQQVEQIKAMQKAGDVLGAQKIILGEVSKEFGGAAAASATSGEKMSVAWGNLKETIGTALLPVLDSAEQAITTKVIPAVSTFVTQIQTGEGAGGRLASVVKTLASNFGTIGPAIAVVVAGMTAYKVAMATAAIVTKIQAAGTVEATAAQWSLNAALTANPIGLVVVALTALGVGLVIAYKKSETFRNIVNGAFSAIRATAQGVARFFSATIPAAFNKITSAASSVLGWVKGHWPALVAILGGPIGAAAALIITHWHQITAGASAMVGGVKAAFGRVISAVASIPGKVVSALGDLGSLLRGAGERLIGGLVDGIQSKVGAVTGAIGNIAGIIKGHLPGSPVKFGALRSWNFGGGVSGAGRRLADGIATGLRARAPKVRTEMQKIASMIGDGLSGKKDQKKIGKVKDSLGKLTDAIKTQLDKQLQAAKDKVSKIADTISSLKDTIKQTASSVAQNYLPDFTTNALFGPDGKMIKGTAVSSFKSQIAAQGSVLSQVTAAYKKLVGEGLNGDWLSSLLQSGNNNLILDLGASSKSDALSAQSMYQNVTAQANALGTAVANNTTSKSQLDTAVKQLAVAQRQELAAQRREKSLNSIDHKLDKLEKLKKLDTLPADITRGLNQSIAAANKGRRS